MGLRRLTYTRMRNVSKLSVHRIIIIKNFVFFTRVIMYFPRVLTISPNMTIDFISRLTSFACDLSIVK